MIGFEEIKEEVENSIEEPPEYNVMSNPAYLRKERKNNLFIENTMTYFSFFVPMSIVVVFLFNRIFYCLFNFEISKYLRPYAFWWVLFEIMIQNNVEYLSFLGFRSLDTSFSVNF